MLLEVRERGIVGGGARETGAGGAECTEVAEAKLSSLA